MTGVLLGGITPIGRRHAHASSAIGIGRWQWEIAPCEADVRPQGWLISVKSPEDIRVDLYATVADTLEHAEVLVGNHCAVSNARIRYERILTDGEVERLGLKPGKVTQYA